MLNFIDAGLMTQWTDLGRTHNQVSGYSQSGAVDWFNFQLANALCGNALNTPALEVMAGNIAFRVSAPCFICVTGAPCRVSVNGELVENDSYPIELRKNDTLTLGATSAGVFTYIAFSLRFKLPLFANSVCAVKREKIGGAKQNGSAITNGESFFLTNEVAGAGVKNLHPKKRKSALVPLLQEVLSAQLAHHKTIPFFFCYQDYAFSALEKQRFIAHTFTVSRHLDKMGVRLEGPAITCKPNSMSSQPMANGAIQVPGNGMPIVMRNDRQTIGGYPVIGTLSSAGLAILSQATTAQSLTFLPFDITNATIWRERIDIALKAVLNNTQV